MVLYICFLRINDTGGTNLLHALLMHPPGLIICSSHSHHMLITCSSHAHHMLIICSSHAHHMLITCSPHAHHMLTTCSSHAHHMLITCSSHAHHMLITCSLHAHHMLINCPSTQTDIESIRSRFYGFVQFAPDNDVAMDISFGSVGYTLALARAFRTVSPPNILTSPNRSRVYSFSFFFGGGGGGEGFVS